MPQQPNLMTSLNIFVVPVPTTMSSFPLILSPTVVISHQVGGIGIIVIIVVRWRKEVVVRGGYDSWWRGGGWFVIFFYDMCRKK